MIVSLITPSNNFPDYLDIKEGDTDEVIKYDMDSRVFEYNVNSEIEVAPFATVIYDTQVEFVAPRDMHNSYTVLVSKEYPDISISIITPVFAKGRPVMIQLTNVGQRLRIIKEDACLFAITLKGARKNTSTKSNGSIVQGPSTTNMVRFESSF